MATGGWRSRALWRTRPYLAPYHRHLAVIVVSSELLELLGLAHRIVVMHEGRTTGTFDAASTTEHELLLACYGSALIGTGRAAS